MDLANVGEVAASLSLHSLESGIQSAGEVFEANDFAAAAESSALTTACTQCPCTDGYDTFHARAIAPTAGATVGAAITRSDTPLAHVDAAASAWSRARSARAVAPPPAATSTTARRIRPNQ
jgi:hypothetical protein